MRAAAAAFPVRLDRSAAPNQGGPAGKSTRRRPPYLPSSPAPAKMGPLQQAPRQHTFASVPAAKRCAIWVERSGAGVAIDAASAALSLLTVAAYIVQTYEPPQSAVFSGLRTLDFALSLPFGAEWCFWLWLAHGRRLRFVFNL